ncbi:MAG: DUF192 domain-containing protein [Gammaproteobacteria bacterium]|jgi:hypothetical protein|nr:DUF192 domain-containing protein [Gammaproteobacteria bacterium]
MKRMFACTLLGAAACLTSQTLAATKTTQLCIDGHEPEITVEIADTFELRQRGLMMREQLGEHEGMWFTYNQERPGYAGFWMFRTLIPLDIAFIDNDMKIVKIITMEPCPSIDPNRCPAYPPQVNYYGAVEVNKGYFEKYNIKEGRHFKRCN